MLNLWANRFYKNAPASADGFEIIELVNPQVTQYGATVKIEKYDIFTTWDKRSPDLIIAANILNRVYFSDAMLLTAISNLISSLKEGGILAVIDSREEERSTLFRKSGQSLITLKKVNGGTEIEKLALSI